MIVGKCLKCHGELHHYDKLVFVKCVECGVREKAQITCKEGHYYCNACASKKVINKLYELLATLEGVNPSDIGERLFVQCGVSGNSPHPITTAAFLVAYKNLTHKITDEDVLEGVSKAAQIPGGWCGYYGNCGAAVGLGVAFAVINKSTPMHDKERSIANLVTAEGLKIVAGQGGPRCCTGSVRGVLNEGIKLAEEYLDVKFPEKTIDMKKCWQSKYNDDCKKQKCVYYGRELEDNEQ